MSKRDPMQISERELAVMTADMVELHETTYPEMRSQLEEAGASMAGGGRREGGLRSSRRSFLFGSALAVGGLMLTAACGSDSDDDSGANGSTGGDGSTSEDVKRLATNASLENLAVFAYGQALADAPKGKFGTVPPVVAGFAQHAMKQHTEHAAAFNAALVKAGGKKFTDPDPALKDMVLQSYSGIKDVAGLANLALTLENTAAATYVKQMGEFTNMEALGAVATIAPVERQHAAILRYVLGQYPVPDTFVPVDLARPSSDAGL